LKRLSYGMLISGDDWFNDGEDSYLLLDKVEGSSANDLVRFNYLIQNLHRFLSELKKDRTLADWAFFIQDGCDLFFDREDDYQLEQLTLEFAKIHAVASSENLLNFEIIHPILQKIIEGV